VVDPAPNPNAGGRWTTNENGDLGVPLRQAGFTLCADAPSPTYEQACAGVTLTSDQSVTLTLQRLAPPIPQLHPDGKIWRDAHDAAWRWKGVSAFALLDRFARGEDLGPFLTAYKGYNVLRVWPYVDWHDPKTGIFTGWNPPTMDVVRGFLTRVQQDGFLVEFTLLTDDDPARLPWARSFVQQLAGTPGVFLEAGNEPETHKAIDTASLISTLQSSGLPWTTGNYEDAMKMRGTYGTAHTARDDEWPRRAHDLLEFFNGGGPNTPSDPPHRFPIIADEPAKLQDVGGAHAVDWRAYFAACALLGGGATFHSETGKYGRPPIGEEVELARIALEALDAFPPDAPTGPYRRPVEQSLRTYVVGNFMVRIRPTSLNAPEPGWTALDASGVMWRR
jgi:hypothetical protein